MRISDWSSDVCSSDLRDMVGVRFAEAFELFGRTAVLEAASRVHVGQDDDLFGRQYIRGFGHEFDASLYLGRALACSFYPTHMLRFSPRGSSVARIRAAGPADHAVDRPPKRY